jgi:hypothetical protein
MKIFQHRQRLKGTTPTGQFVLRSINPLFGHCGVSVIEPFDAEKFS